MLTRWQPLGGDGTPQPTCYRDRPTCPLELHCAMDPKYPCIPVHVPSSWLPYMWGYAPESGFDEEACRGTFVSCHNPPSLDIDEFC